MLVQPSLEVAIPFIKVIKKLTTKIPTAMSHCVSDCEIHIGLCEICMDNGHLMAIGYKRSALVVR